MTTEQHSDPDRDAALDRMRIENLQSILAHIRQYPADDAECQRRRKSRPWRRSKTRPVGEGVRHGARAFHIAGVCHGALARQGQSS